MGNSVKGDDFVTGSEAKEGVRKFLRRNVGPRKGQAPDLVFAIKVIEQTIPKSVLKGEKLDRYNRALQALWRLRDDMCQIETVLDMYWHEEE